MTVALPYPSWGPAEKTLPLPAARMGVPHDAPKSMPAWNACAPVTGSVREPKPLLIGAPAIGRMNVPLPYDGSSATRESAAAISAEAA